MPPLPPADLDHVLEWTLPVWEQLRDARLFITGGTGFFGTWLVESLAWAVDRLKTRTEAVVLTRSPEAFGRRSPHLAGHPAIRLHRGDVRDFAFPSENITHVIHAAFPAGWPPTEVQETVALVVRGTERALQFAERSKAGHFLFTSSGAVYGRQPADLAAIPETYSGAPDPLDPRSAYGESKRLAELLCCLQATRTGLAVKIARCFAFVGPHLPLDAHFAIGNFIRDALRGGPIHICGDGTTVRSYLHAADLAIWLWTILVAGESGRAYNVGSSHAITTGELALLAVRAIAPGAEVHQDRRPDATVPPDRYVPDTSRAARELRLLCRIPLPEAIRRTAEWARR
jgi:nucleoside-diphosphate-sugar epimerase